MGEPLAKKNWQEWASEFARQEARDFADNVELSIHQHAILKAKLEAAALYGMELAATLSEKGFSLSEAKGLRPKLMQQEKGGA